jgi:hypothetical protein
MPYQGRLPYTYKSPYNYTLDQGTQTVPSLAFLGDTNNGLFSPATDNVAITTNGSEKLRVTSDGNIGIGVTNPSSKLHLAQTTSAANFTISNDINNWSIVTGTSVNSFSIVENQFGSTVFHANSSANVGIGTTNPTSKLSVYGGLSIGTSSASGSAHAFIIDGVNNSASNHTLTFSGHPNGTNDSVTWYLNRTGGAYGNFDVQFNGTSRFYISGGSLSNNGNIILNPINHTVISSGNVGIGTTNPEDRLDLASGFIRFKEAIGGTGTYGGIRAYNSLVPSVSATAIRFIRDVAEVGNDGAICFDTTNNERLRITSTGNVGIGTTNPSEKLEVTGKVRIFDGGYPYIDIGITTSNYFRIIHDNPNDRLFIGKNNNASLVITGGNNVEPGADATQNLGSSTKRWANIYSADLQLSNEGSQNDVDGTWGQYTIQEGENDLFLLNRRNGKKYKFVLQEVN